MAVRGKSLMHSPQSSDVAEVRGDVGPHARGETETVGVLDDAGDRGDLGGGMRVGDDDGVRASGC